MSKNNTPKSVKDRVKEWEEKTSNPSNKSTKPTIPPKLTQTQIKSLESQIDSEVHTQVLNIASNLPISSAKPQKPSIPSKPTQTQIKSPESQIDSEVHTHTLNISSNLPISSAKPQKPSTPPKPTKEEIKAWKQTDISLKEKSDQDSGNLTTQEKIEKFFNDYNIDQANTFIPEFSRYIELSKTMQGRKLEVTIKAYEQSIEKLANKVTIHKKDFLKLLDETLKNHPHKDKFDKINQQYSDSTQKNNNQEYRYNQEELTVIINNLRELVNDTHIINMLKQSRKHDEFKEKINNIIKIYEDNQNKPSMSVKLENKLNELDQLCEKAIKIDKSVIWKNIGNFVKYLLTGNKVKANFYKDATKNFAKNNQEVINKIKNSIKKPSASSNPPPKNKKGMYRN